MRKCIAKKAAAVERANTSGWMRREVGVEKESRRAYIFINWINFKNWGEERTREEGKKRTATDKSGMACCWSRCLDMLIKIATWKRFSSQQFFFSLLLDIVGRVDCGQLIISRTRSRHRRDCEFGWLKAATAAGSAQDDVGWRGKLRSTMGAMMMIRARRKKRKRVATCSRTNKICKLNVIKIN